MKILVIDDDKLMLEYMLHNLESKDYDVLVAENSFKALSILEHEEINLIISDVMMPQMSGLELLSVLNEFYFSKIPVIIMSALLEKDIKFALEDLGAKEFIAKPIDFKMLSLCIDKHMR